jgi:hypothetical protein
LFSYFWENSAKIFFYTECVSSTKTLVDDTQKSIKQILFLAEGFNNKMIAKTWAKTKNFAKFCKNFCKNKNFS